MLRLALCGVVAIAVLFSQEFRATLQGRVIDPSGAPVAGSAVRLLNVETNQSILRTTADRGDYTFALMSPGNYELRVEAEGFRAVLRRGIKLEGQPDRSA